MKENQALTDEANDKILPLIMLYYLAHLITNKAKLSWNQLFDNSKEINDNEILSLIFKLKELCSCKIRPNQKLYRARAYKNSEIKEIYNKSHWQELYEKYNADTPEFLQFNSAEKDMESFFKDVFILDKFCGSKNILNNWIKKNKNVKFWGFDANESGRNYKNNIEGRLNQAHEHHLYLAYDINTAIAEIRPINQQQVSVPTINIQKELNVFDLTKKFEIDDGTKDSDYVIFYEVARMCSMPNFNDNTYYKPTQKISSYIKSLGFDGIIYPSALRDKGKNVLIFEFDNPDLDNEYFKIVSSNVYMVSNKITATKVLPLKNINNKPFN